MSLSPDRREAVARRALPLVDLTDLSDGCTEDAVRELWHEASTPYGPVAAVCIWPSFVGVAHEQRRIDPEDARAGGIAIACVLNFPTGEEPAEQVVAMARSAVQAGADEVDLVLPYRAFLAGDEDRARDMVEAVNEATGDQVPVKVILETGEIKDPDAISRASRLAIDAGAGFLKTSTGKSPVSATPEAARIVLEAIRASGRPVGFKASGGIRTAEDAALYLELADRIMGPEWATPKTFRLGASSLLGDLLAAIEGYSAGPERTSRPAGYRHRGPMRRPGRPRPGRPVLPQEIIAAKRDGRALPRDEIEAFVAGITDGSITEGQVAAFAMAVFLNGMSRSECVAMTEAMMRSGMQLDWSDIAAGRPVVDKHSTGGVGDNVSLMLAPALAAAGALVPMISGRGLGHTGGTLDKLDAIPGYQSKPDIATLHRVVADTGVAIIGQTADLAPADRRLYAIRDVTGTVESVPLLTTSILSKKLAAGLDALVLDVKTGSGAFAASREMTEELARSLVEVAAGAGLEAAALVTDMNEPLASAAGNALEILNAVDFLTGRRRDPRLEIVTVALGGEALTLAGLAADAAAGEALIRRAFDDGSAAERFGRMVAALGGPPDFVERARDHLEPAPMIRPLHPPRPGVVAAIDTRALGLAVVELGGGRRRPDDDIDPRVGLSELAGIGEPVGPDRPLCLIHAADESGFAAAAARIAGAYTVGVEATAARTPVIARIAPEAA